MKSQASIPEKMTPPLWQYVPMEDYKPPQRMVSESIRGGIVGLWQRLRSSRKEENAIFAPETKLQALSESLLEKNAPSPDWQTAVQALDNALLSWIDAPEFSPATVLIGLPHSGNADVLWQLSKGKKWALIPPPTLKQILSNDENWLENFWEKRKLPWVLATLERCFLRHVSGLKLVRRFFNELLSMRLGRGIIGCDSWAWAYLKHALDLRLPDTLVLQSFDHERLSAWFQGLANPNKEECTIFRQSDNGSYVLPPPPTGSEANDNHENTSDFLEKLATHCRGIPGISWALWRHSLNTVPEENMGEEIGIDKCSIQHVTLWVTPWEKISLPSPPASQERDQIIILHTLLLHNGLTSDILCQILPFPSDVVNQALFYLKRSGILEQKKTIWRVSALAYPAVRSLLDGEGYITDSF